MTGAARRVGVAPLPMEEWSESARTILPGYLRRPELYLSGGPDAQPMPQALGLFAHHVELGATWMAFTDLLAGKSSTLTPFLRELAILRVAWKTSSSYEWKQHARMGLAAGVTAEQLFAIPDGPGADLWTPFERAVLHAVDETVDSSRIAAETWEVLARDLDDAQLLELTFLIGGYLCFATVANSVRLVPDPPTEEIEAPELPAQED